MARKTKKTADETPPKLTLYTIALSDEEMEKLEGICDDRFLGCYEVKHARFAFKSKREKVNVVGYSSGKLVVQGKGTEDFVRNILESEVTGDPRLGYEEFHNPEWFEPHAGLDEAGKGDLFGPVISACVVADGEMVREWKKKGIRDSKKMTDRSILDLEKVIRNTKGVVVKTAFCGMPKYNELMAKPNANLNRLLAWLHARSLEGALKIKRVPWGLLDQFSKQPLVQNYFKDKTFDLKMRPRAESDPVVAAASICARGVFIRQMDKLSARFGEPLLKGAGGKVKEQGIRLVRKFGPSAFGEYAKLHFRTAYEVLGLPVPEKKQWTRGGGGGE